MMRKTLASLLTVAALTVSGSFARANFDATAIDNATIQPSGPRPGFFGDIFLNIEGSSNGNFASYGVIDFRATATSASLVTSLSVTLFQSNAAFTANGGLSFYVSQDTTTSIQPGTSPLFFNPSATNNGIGSALDPLTFLGTGTFTEVGDTTADTYTFVVPVAIQAYLGQRVSSGGTIRIVIAANQPGTAATYGGVGNFDGAPILSGVTSTSPAVVPEPSSLVLAGMGFAGVAFFARRRAVRVA